MPIKGRLYGMITGRRISNGLIRSRTASHIPLAVAAGLPRLLVTKPHLPVIMPRLFVTKPRFPVIKPRFPATWPRLPFPHRSVVESLVLFLYAYQCEPVRNLILWE